MHFRHFFFFFFFFFFYKRGYFCTSRFPFLYILVLLKRGILKNEIICSEVEPFSEGMQNNFDRVAFLEIVFILLNSLIEIKYL